MFAVFSFIEDFPQIYQIHSHEETCKKSIEQLVKQYIIQKRNFDDKEQLEPLTISPTEITPQTFSKFPTFTYLKINDKTYNIFEHVIVDKIDKGWVWNGTSKVVSSRKIGYFQIQNVIEKNIIEPEISPEEITEEQLQMYQDIENLIDEMLSSIEKGNEEIELEKEQIKNLPLIETKSSPYPSLSFCSESEKNQKKQKENVSFNQSPIKMIYNIESDPLQENIKPYLVEIESKLLSFPHDQEMETLQSVKTEPIDILDSSDYPKWNWNQRGRGGKRNTFRKRGAYKPSHGYAFAKLHLY